MRIPPISDPQPAKSGDRSKALDALRAVAILLVLGRHTNVSEAWTRIGWCGVDLFFVISGFLISGLLFQEYKRFGDIRLKRFWLRRGLKIYPAFYLYTLVLILTLPITFPGAKVPVQRLLVDLVFLSSYFQGLSGHTWSLAIEEHFYLLLPLLLLVLMKLRPKRKDPFTLIPIVFVLIAISSLSFRLAAKPAGFTDYYAYLFPTHLRMDALFCGVMIGYLYHFKPQVLMRVKGWQLLIAGGMLLTPIYFVEMGYRWMFTWGLTCAYLGFACIVAWAIHVPLPRGRLLALPINVLARIGFYSYSIYLWHWIIIFYVRHYVRYKCITSGTPMEWSSRLEIWQWPVSMAVSIVVGIAMAVVVEQPVLRLRDRWFPSCTHPSREVGSALAKHRHPTHWPSDAKSLA